MLCQTAWDRPLRVHAGRDSDSVVGYNVWGIIWMVVQYLAGHYA
jgi:hypothetical protein